MSLIYFFYTMRNRCEKPLPPGVQEFSTLAAMPTARNNNRKVLGDEAYFYRYRYHFGVQPISRHATHDGGWRGEEITARAEMTANAFEN